MPLSLGLVEVIFLLIVWAIPIALVVWFVRSVNGIRDSLRGIERRLDETDRR